MSSTVASLTPPERETIVRTSDAEALVYIDTAQRTVITALRADDRFTETATGWHGGTEWANFTIPAGRYTVRTGAKRTVSEATRLANAKHLAGVRR